MTTLIITLPDSPPAPATLCHCAVTHDGLTTAHHSETALSVLNAPAGAEVVVVVPTQQLSWHRIELPRGTLERNFFSDADATRLRAVLDGLLEDRLLDDPAQLHFALEPGAKSGAPVWVSVCNRTWLHSWIAALEQAQLAPTRIVPEVAPPLASDPAVVTLWVTGTDGDAHLTTSGPNGVTRVPLSDAATGQVLPPDAHHASEAVTTDPAVATIAELHFSGRVDLQSHHQRAVVAAQTAWDLAQLELLRNRRTRIMKHLSAMGNALRSGPQWRAARWAMLAVVVFNLVGLQAWAWREQSAQRAQRSAMDSLLTSTFPDVRVVVNAPLQMARSLSDLQRASGAAAGNDMETILGQFQAAAPESPAPAAIQFIANEVLLKGLDPSSPTLTDVVGRLQAQGYGARWDGDNLSIKQERRP
jgi:general secretion pathway protein L